MLYVVGQLERLQRKALIFGEPATTQTEQTADSAQAPDGVSSVPQTVGSGAEAVAKGMIDAKQPVEVSNDMLKLTIDEVELSSRMPCF